MINKNNKVDSKTNNNNTRSKILNRFNNVLTNTSSGRITSYTSSFFLSFLFLFFLLPFPLINAKEAPHNVSVTVCVISPFTTFFFHADYAARVDTEYRYLWPDLYVNDTLLIGFYNDSSPFDIVRSWVKQDGSERCTIAIGPGYTDGAVAISPVIGNPMWIEFGATSTQLSNLHNYPNFLRVIPSDEQSGARMAEFLLDLDWKHIFILRMDTYYGNTYSNGVVTPFQAGGGIVERIHTFQELSLNVTVLSHIFKNLRQMEESSRIILFVDVDLGIIKKALEESNLETAFILLFGDYACNTFSSKWHGIKGALCVSTILNDEAYLKGYLSRSDEVLNHSLKHLVDAGYPENVSRSERNVTEGAYWAYTVDAVWVGLLTVQKFYSEYHRLPDSSTQMAEFAINKKVNFPYGLTGDVSFNAVGDRIRVRSTMINVQDHHPVSIAELLRNNSVRFFENISLHVLGGTYSISEPPSDRTILKMSFPWWFWLIVVISIFIIIAGIAAVIGMLFCYKPPPKALYAPKNENEPLAMVLTDIESSTALWATLPQEMVGALDMHNAIIRSLIRTYQGYEVKTIGDSFMVAFRSAARAVAFSVAVQEELFLADWGERGYLINEFYSEKYNDGGFYRSFPAVVDVIEPGEGTTNGTNEDDTEKLHPVGPADTAAANASVMEASRVAVDKTLAQNSTDKCLWNGLRVRVGIHYGLCVIRRTDDLSMNEVAAKKTDPGTGVNYEQHGTTDKYHAAYDYFGPTVNIAARIESCGNGGQVLASEAVIEAADRELGRQTSPATDSWGDDVSKKRSSEKLMNNSNSSIKKEDSGEVLSFDSSDDPPAPPVPVPRAIEAPPTLEKEIESIRRVNLGETHLRGVADPITLLQLCRADCLSGRMFAKLRLDRSVDEIGLEESPEDVGTTECQITESDENGLPPFGAHRNPMKPMSTTRSDDRKDTEESRSHSRASSYGNAEGAPPSGKGMRRARLTGDSMTPDSAMHWHQNTYQELQLFCRKRGFREDDVRRGYFALDALFGILPDSTQNAMINALLEGWRITPETMGHRKKSLSKVPMFVRRLFLASRFGPIATFRETKVTRLGLVPPPQTRPQSQQMPTRPQQLDSRRLSACQTQTGLSNGVFANNDNSNNNNNNNDSNTESKVPGDYSYDSETDFVNCSSAHPLSIRTNAPPTGLNDNVNSINNSNHNNNNNNTVTNSIDTNSNDNTTSQYPTVSHNPISLDPNHSNSTLPALQLGKNNRNTNNGSDRTDESFSSPPVQSSTLPPVEPPYNSRSPQQQRPVRNFNEYDENHPQNRIIVAELDGDELL